MPCTLHLGLLKVGQSILMNDISVISTMYLFESGCVDVFPFMLEITRMDCTLCNYFNFVHFFTENNCRQLLQVIWFKF